MQIYKHRLFAKWAKKERISDSILKQAIVEMEDGLFEANLGSGLYKKRIARSGQGKSSSYRTLIAFKQDDKAVFILGFAKNDQENIDCKILESLKKSAYDYLLATPAAMSNAVRNGKLTEVK